MDIECTVSDRNALLSVVGRMDAISAPQFEKSCDELLSKGTTTVIADLTKLEYISSAGLRSILSSAKKLRAAGGSLIFCGLSGMVDDVFRVSGFLKMFRVCATAEEAMAG